MDYINKYKKYKTKYLHVKNNDKNNDSLIGGSKNIYKT